MFTFGDYEWIDLSQNLSSWVRLQVSLATRDSITAIFNVARLVRATTKRC